MESHDDDDKKSKSNESKEEKKEKRKTLSSHRTIRPLSPSDEKMSQTMQRLSRAQKRMSLHRNPLNQAPQQPLNNSQRTNSMFFQTIHQNKVDIIDQFLKENKPKSGIGENLYQEVAHERKRIFQRLPSKKPTNLIEIEKQDVRRTVLKMLDVINEIKEPININNTALYIEKLKPLFPMLATPVLEAMEKDPSWKNKVKITAEDTSIQQPIDKIKKIENEICHAYVFQTLKTAGSFIRLAMSEPEENLAKEGLPKINLSDYNFKHTDPSLLSNVLSHVSDFLADLASKRKGNYLDFISKLNGEQIFQSLSEQANPQDQRQFNAKISEIFDKLKNNQVNQPPKLSPRTK